MKQIGARKRERKKKKTTIDETEASNAEETEEETIVIETRFELTVEPLKDQPQNARNTLMLIMLGAIAT